MNHVRAICIDLDDTLWPIGPVIEQAEAVLYEWFKLHGPEVANNYGIEELHAAREAVLEEHPDQSHNLTFLRKAALAKVVVRAGYSEGLAEQAFSVFWQARNQVTLYSDVVPALLRFKRSCTVLALSNGNADLREVGLDALFDHAVYAADVGAAKPDGAMFRAALELTGLEPNQLLHIGDDPVADMRGAREAGMFTVWLNRKGVCWPDEESPPDAEVTDLGQLADALGL